MVTTVTPKLINIDKAESATGWSTFGNAAGLEASVDQFIQGNYSVSSKTSGANKAGGHYFDIGAGNELNFSTTLSGQCIYMWIQCTPLGLTEAIADGGYWIRIMSSLTDYRDYFIGGFDEQRYAGWVRFAIDPSKTASRAAGTLDLTSVRYFGAGVATTALIKENNLFIDRIDYGTGLAVHSGTSSSPATWDDIVTQDTGPTANRYGIVRTSAGVIFALGSFEFGTSGAVDSYFQDNDEIVIWEDRIYYSASGAATHSLLPANYYNVNAVGSGSVNSFVDGYLVGTGDTARGRNGCLFSSEGPGVAFDFSGNNIDTTKLYGTTFKNIVDGIVLGTAGHLAYAATFDQCGQVDPSRTKIRNCIFSGTEDMYGVTTAGAAMLWNANINIKKSNFIANTDATYNPHGIQHDAAGEYDYIDLVFAGNDYDILFTGTGQLTINASGVSDPQTYEIFTPATGSVDIVNTKTLAVHVQDEAQDDIASAAVRIENASTRAEISSGVTDGNGDYIDATYNYGGDVAVTVKIRKSTTGTRYFPKSPQSTITANGLTLTETLIEDTIAE